jgi:hypothetical protein
MIFARPGGHAWRQHDHTKIVGAPAVTARSQRTPATTLSAEDRLALRALVEQYFYGIDHGDAAASAGCFAETCFFQINVEPPMVFESRDEVGAAFSTNKLFEASDHSVSHHTLWMDGERICGAAYAIAHLVMRPAESRRLLVRGLRYDDEYVVELGAWRIKRRIHNPLWQYEVVATAPGLD